jgi:hypothetical protein
MRESKPAITRDWTCTTSARRLVPQAWTQRHQEATMHEGTAGAASCSMPSTAASLQETSRIFPIPTSRDAAHLDLHDRSEQRRKKPQQMDVLSPLPYPNGGAAV